MAAAPPVFGSRQIQAALATFLSPRSVIVGVGNLTSSDDRFGPAVIESLRGRCPAALLDAGLTPENYAQRIVALRPSSVLVLDAAEVGLRRGELALCEPDCLDGGLGTHGGSLLLLARYLQVAADAPVRFLLAERECTARGRGRSVRTRVPPRGTSRGRDPTMRTVVARATRLVRGAFVDHA